MELSARDDTGHGYAAVRVLPTIRQYWQRDLRRGVNLPSYLYLIAAEFKAWTSPAGVTWIAKFAKILRSVNLRVTFRRA